MYLSTGVSGISDKRCPLSHPSGAGSNRREVSTSCRVLRGQASTAPFHELLFACMEFQGGDDFVRRSVASVRHVGSSLS